MNNTDYLRASRVAFIAALGGPLRVARERGMKNHSRVCNWYDKGFPNDQKAPLLDMATTRIAKGHEVEIPPELYEGRKTWRWKGQEKTPLNLFLKQIAAAYGGNREFAAASGIPLSSIMSMRKTNLSLMAMHVPAIEKAALDVGVSPPDWWVTAREKYAAWVTKMERRRRLHEKDLDYTDEAMP